MKKFRFITLNAVVAVVAGITLCMSGCGAKGAPAGGSQPAGNEGAAAGTVTETMAEGQGATEKETEAANETVTEKEAETGTAPEKETGTGEETEKETGTAKENPEETKTSDVQKDVPSTVNEGSVSPEDYAITVKGVSIPLKGDMRDYTALIGEPDQFSEARSCTEGGTDKVYTYGGIIIYTYITNGADIVSLIEVEGSEPLGSGIHIGSTKDEVIAAYGNGYREEDGEFLYETGGGTIGLQMTGDKVSFMEIY